LAPSGAARAKVKLLRAFDPDAPHGAEVPDPYYGGPDGFADVFEICEAACRNLLEHVVEQLESRRR
jgi:protein-tyrosine phosphatase